MTESKNSEPPAEVRFYLPLTEGIEFDPSKIVAEGQRMRILHHGVEVGVGVVEKIMPKGFTVVVTGISVDGGGTYSVVE